jgi:hypothetical protein
LVAPVLAACLPAGARAARTVILVIDHPDGQLEMLAILDATLDVIVQGEQPSNVQLIGALADPGRTAKRRVWAEPVGLEAREALQVTGRAELLTPRDPGARTGKHRI